jgi:hypothetical protein
MDADVLPGVDVARQLLTAALVTLVVTVAGCTSGDDTTDTATSSTLSVTPTTVAITTSTTSTTQPTTTSTTTTTTLPEPPHLEVLDPAHGATVTSARYTFTGVTDPGCTITVGDKYEATIEEDGTWSLDLMLEPGRNSTTFTATHPETGLHSSQAIRVYYAEAVELRADGLGAVSFGQDETTTMAILTGLFGPPATETVCGDLDSCVVMAYGRCRYIHEAAWPKQDLSILTADCEDWDDGWPDAPEFTTWYVGSGSTLRTREGVGPGSTLAELKTVYGDRLVMGYDDSCGGLHLAILESDGGHGLHGHIPKPPGFEPPDHYPEYPGDPSGSDLDLNPATRVFSFEAGRGQSC